jgi:hypothetical protein
VQVRETIGTTWGSRKLQNNNDQVSLFITADVDRWWHALQRNG